MWKVTIEDKVRNEEVVALCPNPDAAFRTIRNWMVGSMITEPGSEHTLVPEQNSDGPGGRMAVDPEVGRCLTIGLSVALRAAEAFEASPDFHRKGMMFDLREPFDGALVIKLEGAA